MKKIVFVTATPETISAFLLSYIKALSSPYELHVITNLSNAASIRGLDNTIQVHSIEIARKPSIKKDFLALISLYKLFRSEKYDVVHSFTPKAGLLSQLSAFFARVNCRLHTFTGQVWVTQTGLSRFFLKFFDKIIVNLSTFCLVDSPSQQDFLIKEGVLAKNNSQVLSQGSISGVNVNKFVFNSEHRNTLRKLHNVSDDDFVFMFVGRLNTEKGVPELVNAFNGIKTQRSIKLFIIGSDEENLGSLVKGYQNIHYIGFQSNVVEYYSFADMLCLPSHREGFGNVIIEAASCHLPAIASNIYGLNDAVQDGYSGLLHEVKSSASIQQCMECVLNTPSKTDAMKNNARKRVKKVFDEKLLINEFIAFYKSMLK